MTMTNEEIAMKVAELTYPGYSNPDDSNYAIMLLIDKLLIPKDIDSYNRKQMENQLLWHLNTQDEMLNNDIFKEDLKEYKNKIDASRINDYSPKSRHGKVYDF